MKKGVLLAAAFFILSIFIRYYLVDPLSADRHHLELDDDVLKSPGPTILHLASMEHPQGWADIVWLGIVQELGHAKRSKVSFDRVQRWAHISLDLDPNYFTVYYTSATHLTAWADRADASDEILRKGMKHLPQRWEFPFLMGYNDYFVRGECNAATEDWKRTSKLPNPPRFILSLVGRSMVQCGSSAEALRFLVMQEAELPEGPLKDDVKIRIKLIKSNPILDAYERVCEQHRAETGSLPENGVAAQKWAQSRGIMGLPEPKDLLGEPISRFDFKAEKNRCYARTQYILRRDDEAKEMDLGMYREQAVTSTVTQED